MRRCVLLPMVAGAILAVPCGAQEDVSEQHGDWTVHFSRDLISDARSEVYLSTPRLNSVAGQDANELVIFCGDSPFWSAEDGVPQVAIFFGSLWGDEGADGEVIVRFDDSQPESAVSWERRASLTRESAASARRTARESARLSPELAQLGRLLSGMAEALSYTEFLHPASSTFIARAAPASRVAVQLTNGPRTEQYMYSLRGISAALRSSPECNRD